MLTNKEFALLEHLMLNRGQCVSRVELLESVWNLEPAQTTNIVDVYINYLRRKLKDPPPGHLIRTVRGRGYVVPSEAELALAVPPVSLMPAAVISAIDARFLMFTRSLSIKSRSRLPSGQEKSHALALSVPVRYLSKSRIRPRTALVASADRSFRQRLTQILTGLRWQVREAEGGAQAWAEAAVFSRPKRSSSTPGCPISIWHEFLNDFKRAFPQVDLVAAGGARRRRVRAGPIVRNCSTPCAAVRIPTRPPGTWRLRSANDSEDAAHVAPWVDPACPCLRALPQPIAAGTWIRPPSRIAVRRHQTPTPVPANSRTRGTDPAASDRLPELIGDAPCMLEVSRRVRLVAPRLTPVLIEGPTGSGKELVAEALHRLSPR